jgi:RHS repeat-associated protein
MKAAVPTIAVLLCATIHVAADARYYDASAGRFISPDTIVQAPADPQSLNRYSYVRNNPMVLTDPSGHSWLSKTLAKVVPFVNPYIVPTWTAQSVKENKEAYIAGGVAFITSGGNPVVAAAAFAAEMGMQTGEGRQATTRVAHEVFIDVFGMNPQTAYISSNIALRMVMMAGMERTWTAIAPNQLHAVPLDARPENIAGGSAAPNDPFGPSARNGGTREARGERYFALKDKNGNQVGTAMDRPLQGIRSVSQPLRLDHTGINVIGYNGGSVPGQLYGTWGVCHTAANRTLFQAGYGSTVSSLGVGHWTTHFTSIIYGNYGGGLYRAAYWGYDASN